MAKDLAPLAQRFAGPFSSEPRNPGVPWFMLMAYFIPGWLAPWPVGWTSELTFVWIYDHSYRGSSMYPQLYIYT